MMGTKLNFKEQNEFHKKVYQFFADRYIGDIIELKPASLNRHYIKFKSKQDVWFQVLHEKIEVDSVDFEKRTISGFISNTAKFKTT
jgi:hypothetical protein